MTARHRVNNRGLIRNDDLTYTAIKPADAVHILDSCEIVVNSRQLVDTKRYD